MDMPPIPDIPNDDYDADDDCDTGSDLDGAEGKPLLSLKQTEFSLKQFAKRLRQANYCACNKWNHVRVAGFLKNKH